jgi:diaminopimelate decarboxylase
MLLGTQRINSQGHLEVGGCDTVELARRFGTPLYVMDEACLRGVCRAYRDAFERCFRDSLVVFAGKAFLTLAMCRIADEEGMGLDVSSAGELHTGLRAGFPPQRIIMHGNNKSLAEMEMALEAGVGRIVIDSEVEIEVLQRVAAQRRAVADVLVRVTPGIEAHTHEYVQTGKIDTKFGIGIGTGQALLAIERVLASPNLRLHGLHCHIGSQLLDLRPFDIATRMMVDFMCDAREATGYVARELDLGGGLGARYRATDHPPSVEAYAETISKALREQCQRHALPEPKLMGEPGRSIVGEAGLTLYTVGVIKDIPGVRTYAAVDGGMSDNPRPALYQAEYELVVANKAAPPVGANEPGRRMKVTISGKHCETDTLITDIEVPELEVGDIVAVQTTGAYNYSMSSNYNRLPRPAVVLVHEGQAEVIVERETLDDLLRQDRIPPRLERH